jgi:hypothetical protein
MFLIVGNNGHLSRLVQQIVLSEVKYHANLAPLVGKHFNPRGFFGFLHSLGQEWSLKKAQHGGRWLCPYDF